MSLSHLPLTDQAVFVLAALVLLTAFALLAQSRLVSAVHTFAWQGALVAAVAALLAVTGDQPHLLISALLTLSLKALLIPWLLHRLIRHMNLERHVETVAYPAFITLAAAAMVIFSYWITLPITRLDLASTRNILAISLSVVLLGLLMMVARRQAVSQVIGFMSMENGLFLSAVAATRGMPLVVELGVAFDVLVAAVLFGLFFLQIRDAIDSLDTDRLNRLASTDREAGP